MPSPKLLWLLPLVLLAACGQGNNNVGFSQEAASSVNASIADTMEGPENEAIQPDERNVIRTADFHCKVVNVLNAVTLIEQQVKAIGGSVAQSRIINTSNGNRNVYYKADSLKKVQLYSTEAYLTVRIPAHLFDTVVNSIPALTSFIESRQLGQKDVTLQYLSNTLLNRPDDSKLSASKALELAGDSREVAYVQHDNEVRKEKVIGRRIENLRLIDNVSFATLTINLTQPDQVYSQIIANPDYIMREPFTTRFKIAMFNGFDLLGNIIIGLMDIWPVLLIVSTGFITAFVLLRRKSKINFARQN